MPKFICCGDAHVTNKTPTNRVDEFPEAQYHKIETILNAAYEDVIVRGIIFPGDFFDTHKVPLWVVERYIRLFNDYYDKANIPIYVVFGQHDQRYHTTEKENTPLGVLLAGCRGVTLLGSEPTVYQNYDNKPINLYGLSWGDDIPEIQNEDAINILVMHLMVVDEKLWEEQSEYIRGKFFLKDHKFNLVVAGDNHQSFVTRYRSQTLVNCGSLMRSTSAQVDHRPMYAVWDSETNELEVVHLKVKSSSRVFDHEKIDKSKDREEEHLDSFVIGLEENESIGVKFSERLRKEIKDNATLKPSVVEIIENALRKGEENERR